MASTKETIIKLLESADIKINGNRSWDIKVYDERLYKRALAEGNLGFAEAYMDGWWDCKQIDVMICKLLSANLEKKVVPWKIILGVLKARLINMQDKNKSKVVAEQHYDLGNDFYKDMLDKRMQYTCGYWKDTKTLDQAQEAKLDLVCKKLQLKKGDRVLELGCGWGWFAKYASEKYGCHVTAYNISDEQVKYARAICKGLPVEIVRDDYREAKGAYDKIVSVGMCEHVGYKNYKTFMKLANKCLKDHGLFLIHTIAGNTSVKNTDRWIAKYIFPNSMLPSAKQLSSAFEGLFVLEDWHSFGAYYDLTLMAWFANFEKNWKKHSNKYGKRFYRMWTYYLLSCAGSFRARKNQLWQIVLSKNGVEGVYKAIR